MKATEGRKVTLRKGDILSLEAPVDSPVVTELGEVTDIFFNFTYDELVDKLKTKTNKTRKAKTEGARFSRLIALYSRATLTGKWSSGATIDTYKAGSMLAYMLDTIPEEEYVNITDKALLNLESVYRSHYTSFLLADKEAIIIFWKSATKAKDLAKNNR